MSAIAQKATPSAPERSSGARRGVLQRKCACGGSVSSGGECEECRKKKVSMRRYYTGGGNDVNTAPREVTATLSQPGSALSPEIRDYYGEKFGFNFNSVRVHTDNAAQRSAEMVNASAYTVGRHVVFGRNAFDPYTLTGTRLLAHELAHVVQQDASDHIPTKINVEPASSIFEAEADRAASKAMAGTHGQLFNQVKPGMGTDSIPRTSRTAPSLQRACLSAAECAAPQATLENFVADTTSKPENVSKAAKRNSACNKVPRDPACTSDGHGAKATALTSILAKHYPSRLGYVTSIVVDKDMPSTWGAVTRPCGAFIPPLPGTTCTFVPDTLEAEAKLYNSGSKTIGGMSRSDWLTSAIGTLTHETEHARFDARASIPDSNACKFADHKNNLSEMAAHLSEMHVYYRDALARPEKDRFKRFYAKFSYWVKNGSEDISGIVKNIRCKCECVDADNLIKQTVESVSNSQKWDTYEQKLIHEELREAKWALNWPVAPPAAVTVTDLPETNPAALKFE